MPFLKKLLIQSEIVIASSYVLFRLAINVVVIVVVVVVVVGNFFYTQDYFSLFNCRGKMSSDTWDT